MSSLVSRQETSPRARRKSASSQEDDRAEFHGTLEDTDERGRTRTTPPDHNRCTRTSESLLASFNRRVVPACPLMVHGYRPPCCARLGPVKGRVRGREPSSSVPDLRPAFSLGCTYTDVLRDLPKMWHIEDRRQPSCLYRTVGARHSTLRREQSRPHQKPSTAVPSGNGARLAAKESKPRKQDSADHRKRGKGTHALSTHHVPEDTWQMRSAGKRPCSISVTLRPGSNKSYALQSRSRMAGWPGVM